LQTLLDKAAASFQAKRPHETIPILLEARRLLRSLSGDLVARKLRELDEVLLQCAGVSAEAVAERPYAVAESIMPVKVRVVNRSPVSMQLEAAYLEGAAASARTADLKENLPVEQALQWPVRRASALAKFRFRIGAEPIEITRSVTYRYIDKVLGERTQPFAAVPPVSIAFSERSILFRDASARQITVRVKSFAPVVAGKLSLHVPAEWKIQPAAQEFRLDKDQQEATLRFEVTPPATPSTIDVRAVVNIQEQAYDQSIIVIRYPHIPTQIVSQPAGVRFTRADVRVLAKNVGYVEGAGDEVPAAIRQLGCDVKFLTNEDLTNGDLDEYDVIVTGVRAFNLREDLRSNVGRLNEYVRKGGALIVQYNTLDNVPATLGPWPIKIGSGRVSVEEAPVNVTLPKSVVLNFPNKIGMADFEGWIQERGLYFPSQWDKNYEAPIASSDPGEKPLSGGILFARHDEGAYVFTSYSWFRQLPAGVPGAYRIFANFLSQ
jgi:hypothetical protein